MPHDDSVGDLIAAIYDTIIDPSRWDEVVRRIVEATGSVSGALVNHEADGAHRAALFNIDPAYADGNALQAAYRINPLAATARAIRPGEVRTGTHITQTDSFRASAFYNEYFRPQQLADVAGIGLLRRPDTTTILTIYRSQDAIWVEPPEWHLLETLAPHLKRAAELHRLLSRARALTDSLGVAVAAAGFAVILLSEDCRILFANAKAEDLLRCGIGLHCERGRLVVSTSILTQRLHALARQGTRPDRAGGEIGGTLELPRGEGRPPLLAHVIPLAPNRALSLFDIDRPAAAVFAADLGSDLSAQVQRFAERFGLTPGETRVLGEIIGGNGLSAAAMKLKIARPTARTHAQRIFDKTGTQRQTELIRLFFEMAMSGSPSGS